MTEQVIYELGLRDKMSSGIAGATSSVRTLESTLGGVKSLLGGIGIGLAAFKGFEFLQQSNEMWEKMEFSMSQVEAALKSTQGAAGLTFEELKKGAEDTAHSLKFTQAEIMGMQSLLLTFPSVTKETFGQASTIIEDMSTRLGQDLKSSTIQLGKALQDPERGITALRRVGVNFNDEQTKMIKNLAATNHIAEAQAMILRELTLEFGGSAAAAADADKSFRLDKTMEENKVILGEMIDKIKADLMPVLISVANGFKNVIGWVKEHGEGLKKIIVSLGLAFIAYKAMVVIPAIFLAIENAAVAAAMGTGGFGAAMTAALGPIGLMAVAIGGLAAVFMTLAGNIEDARKKRNEFIDQGRDQELDYIKTLKDVHGKDNAGFNSAIEKEKAQLRSERDDLNAKANLTTDVDRLTELNMAVNDKNSRLNVIDQYQQGLIKTPDAKKAGAVPGTGAVTPDAKTKATGSKAVTINVTIKDLIGTQNINTTNLRESAGKIKDVVVAALTGAVNDFQVVAGQP